MSAPACGRARRKIGNESLNVLRTKGGRLEHHFGHGRRNLAAVPAALNLLAFAFHTVRDLADDLRQRASTVHLAFPTRRIPLAALATGQPPPQPA